MIYGFIIAILAGVLLRGCKEENLKNVYPEEENEDENSCSLNLEKNTPASSGEIEKCKKLYESKVTFSKNPTVISLYFIRHAESKWNKAKKDNPNTYWLKAPALSDATLSMNGRDQAMKLGVRIRTQFGFGEDDISEDHRKFLSGEIDAPDGEEVVYAVSNLRRAALTLLLVLSSRIEGSYNFDSKNYSPIKKIKVLSALQEISRNTDAKSKSEKGERPAFSINDLNPQLSCIKLNSLFDPACNIGNREPSKTQDRLNGFCNWLIDQAINKNVRHFVIVGHSTWLFEFYKKFKLSAGNEVESKLSGYTVVGNKKKMNKLGNSGVINTKISLNHGGIKCLIIPNSSVLLTKDVNIAPSGIVQDDE
jgi:hypothetical protein